jgi:hypothetical protein
MTDLFNPSKQAAAMLSSMREMNDEDLEWLNDMGMGIASTLEEITTRIENPTKVRVQGCEVIHLGAELFLPMRTLKRKLESNDLEFETYIKDLDQIVEKLDQLVFENQKVLSNPKVRNHMRQLANAVILHLEAGPVLNGMFKNLEGA